MVKGNGVSFTCRTKLPEDVNTSPGTVQLGVRSIAWRREGGYRLGMIPPTKPSYAGYRFPPEVICHTIWLYFRFPLSLRMEPWCTDRFAAW